MGQDAGLGGAGVSGALPERCATSLSQMPAASRRFLGDIPGPSQDGLS